MASQEKSVRQFIKEMRAAGFDFEYKASNDAGLVVKSKGWVDDNRVYVEISPVLEFKKEKKPLSRRRK